MQKRFDDYHRKQLMQTPKMVPIAPKGKSKFAKKYMASARDKGLRLIQTNRHGIKELARDQGNDFSDIETTNDLLEKFPMFSAGQQTEMVDQNSGNFCYQKDQLFLKNFS